MSSNRVVVVGSINRDLTVFTPRHPSPGETVLGTGHLAGPGGKGANQAVAAARFGATVTMVGMVGDDPEGAAMRESLAGSGVDDSAVTTDPDNPTGLAVITVDSSGENSIVVSPGANLAVDPSSVDTHRAVIEDADVVLCQLEIPVETVLAATLATRGTFVLNAAPARELPSGLWEQIDVLVVNTSELEILTGSSDPLRIAGIKGPKAVVVTVGAEGAYYSHDGAVYRCPAPEVDAVDTTGAGDAFCGALAARLASGARLPDAIRDAVIAGSGAVTGKGAQFMPDAATLAALAGRMGPVETAVPPAPV
jgi:ribokinase